MQPHSQDATQDSTRALRGVSTQPCQRLSWTRARGGRTERSVLLLHHRKPPATTLNRTHPRNPSRTMTDAPCQVCQPKTLLETLLQNKTQSCKQKGNSDL